MEGNTISETMDLAEMFRYALEKKVIFRGSCYCFAIGDVGKIDTDELDSAYTRVKLEIETAEKSLKGLPEEEMLTDRCKMAVLKALIEGREKDAERAKELSAFQERKAALEKALKEKEQKRIEELDEAGLKSEIETLNARIKANKLRESPAEPVADASSEPQA